MEEIPREEGEVPPVETETPQRDRGPSWISGLVSRVNLAFLIVAAMLGFVAVNSDPWWIVRPIGSTAILQVGVSPFFVQISALGLPSSVPNADIIGTLSRVMLAGAATALAGLGFFPLSIWKKPVLWLSLSAIAGVFLNFLLLLHSAQVILLQQYGIMPQLTGDTVIQGVVIGTDLGTYSSPTISSSLGPSFFVAVLGFILLGGSEFARYVLQSRPNLDLSSLVSGISGAFLSPPYEHAWLTSDDQALNPLAQDPNRLTDDELAVSFEKLEKALKPGASVSVVLPPWASQLNNRLIRVVPWTGLDLENSQVIFRTPGKPENELVFHKPSEPDEVGSEKAGRVETESESPNPSSIGIQEELSGENDLEDELQEEGLENDLYQPKRSKLLERPPVETETEDPEWAPSEQDQLEKAIVEAATGLIENAGEPVPYQDLISQVHSIIVGQDIVLESDSQIEEVLMKHVEEELLLLERADESGTGVERAWWLEEVEVAPESKFSKGVRAQFKNIGARVRKIKGILGSTSEPAPESANEEVLLNEDEEYSSADESEQSDQS